MQSSFPVHPANSANSISSANFALPGASAASDAAHGPRQLEDEVLQSAEEAVLVEAGAMESADLSTARPLPEAIRARHRQNLPSRYEDAIRRYVAAQPYQSALLAAVAGALVALALRSGWSRGRKR